jgi:hypothetical protein
MDIFEWINEGIARQHLIDIAMIKFSSIFFGLLLATILPVLTEIHFGWYLAAMLLLAVKPVHKMLLR